MLRNFLLIAQTPLLGEEGKGRYFAIQAIASTRLLAFLPIVQTLRAALAYQSVLKPL
jgi:hypothetical protein